MARINRITTNHREIKKWVESHDGKPAITDHPDAKRDKVGLRITFSSRKEETVLTASKPTFHVSWDKFFKLFEEKNLAFSYVDRKKVDDLTFAYMFLPRSSI
jgi:hypothetical protein